MATLKYTTHHEDKHLYPSTRSRKSVTFSHCTDFDDLEKTEIHPLWQQNIMQQTEHCRWLPIRDIGMNDTGFKVTGSRTERERERGRLYSPSAYLGSQL